MENTEKFKKDACWDLPSFNDVSQIDACWNLSFFDVSKMKKNHIALYIGKRATGKSTAILDYLSHNNDISRVMCISPHAGKPYDAYTGKIPSKFMHEEYSPELLEKFIRKQKNLIYKVRMDPSVDPNAFLILDDCLYDAKSWINDVNLRTIFLNGKCLNITLLLAKNSLDIPLLLRDNIDFIFIFKETNIATKRRLFIQYASMFPTFEMFCQVLDQYTRDHGCLVIDNRVQRDKLEDQVFWYRADVNKAKRIRRVRRVRKVRKMKKSEEKDLLQQSATRCAP